MTLRQRIINPVLYRLGYLHYTNTIGATLSGDAETVGALVSGIVWFPADAYAPRGIHVEFTGTVVDPDDVEDSDEDDTPPQRVALVPVTRLNEAEEHHRVVEAELRESRDAAQAEVERLTAFKHLTPRIEIDCGGPVPYVQILNPSPPPKMPIPLPEDLRGWLHPTADQVFPEMREALAAVFGSHRELNSVITPSMVFEQLVHVRDQKPVEVHHHDIEKHAESYMEGYTAAERQATEPLPGYDEPDTGNPAHLRFAAALMASTNDWVHGSFHQGISAHLRAEADLIENTQARSERIEELAADLFGHMPRGGAGGCSRPRRYELAAFLVDEGYVKGTCGEVAAASEGDQQCDRSL